MKKLGIFVAAGAMMLALAGCGKITVDPSEFVTVNFEGYDTLGTATYEFDYKHFIREYEDTLKLTGAGKKASEEMEEEVDKKGEELGVKFHDSPADYLAVYIGGSLDKTDALSNGDSVTWKWDADTDKIAEYFNCDIVLEDKSFKVEGLTEAEAFDPFEGLEVVFSGTAPNGQARLSTSYCEKCSGISFEIDKQSGLSNGDTVTVTASSYGDDLVSYIVENYGMLPTEEVKTFTVSGLPEYILSAADLSDATLDKMIAQAKDALTASAANWGTAELIDAEYIGNYFLAAKNPDVWGDQNSITLVFREDMECTYTKDKTDFITYNSIYYGFTWTNVMVLEDGTETLDLGSYRKRYSYIPVTYYYKDRKGKELSTNYYFDGYSDLDSMFNDIVTKNVENYSYENNVTDTEPQYPVEEAEEEEEEEEDE